MPLASVFSDEVEAKQRENRVTSCIAKKNKICGNHFLLNFHISEITKRKRPGGSMPRHIKKPTQVQAC